MAKKKCCKKVIKKGYSCKSCPLHAAEKPEKSKKKKSKKNKK